MRRDVSTLGPLPPASLHQWWGIQEGVCIQSQAPWPGEALVRPVTPGPLLWRAAEMGWGRPGPPQP